MQNLSSWGGVCGAFLQNQRQWRIREIAPKLPWKMWHAFLCLLLVFISFHVSFYNICRCPCQSYLMFSHCPFVSPVEAKQLPDEEERKRKKAPQRSRIFRTRKSRKSRGLTMHFLPRSLQILCQPYNACKMLMSDPKHIKVWPLKT